MRKLVLGLLGAAALTVGSGANAATISKDEINSSDLNTYLSEIFGELRGNEDPAVEFTQSFNFELFSDYLTNSQVSSVFLSTTDVDLSSVFLDGFAFTQTGFDPLTETWTLTPPQTLTAGWHTITVKGFVTGTNHSGSYSGNLNLTAVPEPATWGMMLLGFGAVGFSMRRRRQPVLAQAA